MSSDLVKFRIRYDYDNKLFELIDAKGHVVATGDNGRKLGKLAWNSGADWVCYDYDLNIDEK